MRKLVIIGIFSYLAIIFTTITPASSNVSVTIDISQQKMYVSVNGKRKYSWPVSTARKGYYTPRGTFRPTRMHRSYYSRKYNNSPMPHSIFFHKGWAIHGTTSISKLGRPASHGCVRLHPDNARRLFNTVKANGSGSTRIYVRN